MSDEIIYPPGTTCEISPHRPTKDTSVPQRSILHLYEEIREAGKNKGKIITALRKAGWIPWNDVPPDVWELLEWASNSQQKQTTSAD